MAEDPERLEPRGGQKKLKSGGETLGKWPPLPFPEGPGSGILGRKAGSRKILKGPKKGRFFLTFSHGLSIFLLRVLHILNL
jgi:hypothetical protein